MTLREFLEAQKETSDYTFTIAKTYNDEHTPFNHYEYYQTPIRANWEWLQGSWVDKNYIVLNPNSCPIDITGDWQRRFNKGWLKCAVVVTLEDMKKRYPNDEQFNELVEWYDKQIREYIKGVK